MSLDFSKLIGAVSDQHTVVGGVVTLLETLVEKLKEAAAALAAALAANDPEAAAAAQAQIDDVTAQIAADTQTLAKAVADNTPAA